MRAKTVVVYESMFGNTQRIAENIARGLRETTEVIVGTVDEIAPEQVGDASLVVAGGPTQNYGMAKADARQKLAKARFGKPQQALLPGRESLRGWLDRLPPGRVLAAAFDTRYAHARLLTGSAALKIAAALGEKGYSSVPAQSFFVRGVGGPLVDGECERAEAWGRELAARVATGEADHRNSAA